MPICFEVLHAIPGRVRLRIPETKNNPSLADTIAERLSSKQGITSVRTNAICASMVIGYDTAVLHTFVPEKHLNGVKLTEEKGHVDIEVGCNGKSKLRRARALLGRLTKLIVPTAALAFSLISRVVPIVPLYGLAAAAAAPVFQRAALTIRREKRLGVDFLDATAIAIMGFQRNLPTCAFMSWLISIGEHIREETARKSEKAIAELLEFHSDFAVILKGRKRIQIRVERLKPGDLVVVNAGDVISVDGIIFSGRAGVDHKSLTGESALSDRAAGSSVYAGSIAIDGELIIRATAVGIHTRAGKIVQMLRAAPAHETKIQDYAARFADQLVLPTLAASGAVYACSGSLTRALSMLIVDFGTGVRVATPTAFLSFMTYAAQKNIVIKGGRAMEKLAKTDAVIFDKTGTLTTGQPEIQDILVINKRFSQRGILKLAAAAETGLNHPVANALANKAGDIRMRLPEKSEARLKVGLGVSAMVNGSEVLVGSERLMEEAGIDITAAQEARQKFGKEAKSLLYVAVKRKLAGIITYSDKLRDESKNVVNGLRALGIDDIIMLTGDSEDAARVISSEVGIEHYISEVFPEKKLEILRKMQKAGKTVAVIGDGINDSLALAHADVSIAPAGAADAAKEAADVLLMEDDLGLVVEAFAIAKSAVELVRQNFKIVAVPNAGAVALAASGLLGPPGATLINNGSTIAAALNGLRPLLSRRNGNSSIGTNRFAKSNR